MQKLARRALVRARKQMLVIDFVEVGHDHFDVQFIDGSPWAMSTEEVMIFTKGLRIGFAVGRFGPTVNA